MLESASNLSEAVHLGGYEMSADGGVVKMSASDFSYLSEENEVEHAFLETQAPGR